MRKSPEAPRESRSAFLGDLLDTLTDRGRALLRRRERPGPVAAPGPRGPRRPAPVAARRSLGRRPRAGAARRLRRGRDRGAARLPPDARRSFRPRPRRRRGGDRGAAPGGRRHRGGRGAARRGRAAAAGAGPPAEPRAGRHRGAGPDARGAPEAPSQASRASPRGRGLRPPVRLLVQPRLPGAPAHRLDDAGEHPREDHPLRGGARDPELGRPPEPARADRPALLRLLPPAARRRAADLRRGGADRGDPRRRRAAARPRADPDRGGGGEHRGLLLDLEHPARPRRRLLRQLPDQAGGRGPEGRAAEHPDLRHPLAGAGLRRLARARARERGLRGARRGDAARPCGRSTRPAGTSTRQTAETRARRADPGRRALLPEGQGPRTAARSTRSRASISATAPGSSG